jgi:hypothetical protein
MADGMKKADQRRVMESDGNAGQEDQDREQQEDTF